MADVFIKKGKARPFWFRHPWVFSGAVDHVEGAPQDGEIVTVVDVDGSFIGQGLYNHRSQIRVRILSHDPAEVLDTDFFRARMNRAIDLREKVLRFEAQGTTGYRLVHGEGDGLGGVVVDRYADDLVIQFSALGMKQRERAFLDLLIERFAPRCIYENANFPYRDAEGLAAENAVRHGEMNEGAVRFREHGLDYSVDLRHCQKTGHYFDQRDNRSIVSRFAVGRTVLDAFCYTGGFALNAARAGAGDVVAVDSSGPAIGRATENAELNDLGDQVEWIEADVPEFLAEARAGGRSYGMVVFDPPKFAVAKKDQQNALHRYRELNAAAMQVVEPGGFLATASCSFHVSEADFEGALNEAAKQSGRFLQILARGGQALDHPVCSACLEGRYLKFVLARVG